MKNAIKKVTSFLRYVFGYAIMITLFVGGFTFFGYLAALCIGGSTATAICVFIYEQIVPIMVKITTSMIVLGLVVMYLSGETALTAAKKDKKKKSEKTETAEKEKE